MFAGGRQTGVFNAPCPSISAALRLPLRVGNAVARGGLWWVRAAVKGLKGAEARPVGKDIETKVLWAVEESLGEVGGGK